MKKLFFVFLAMATVTFATADPWEDVTEEQAKKIVEHLKLHPYILDYCDCCENNELSLLRVVSTEIVECSYNNEKKTVIAKVVKIGTFGVVNDMCDESSFEENRNGVIEDFIVSMNYTFVYAANKWKAEPFYSVIPYENTHVCKEWVAFPNATKTLDKGRYQKWFKKNIND